jgi:hypothetical protein
VFGEIQNQTGAVIYPRPKAARSPQRWRLGNLGNAHTTTEFQVAIGVAKP